jgi:succinate dehydrogenase/fumarate reductase-like Fe-S protein
MFKRRQSKINEPTVTIEFEGKELIANANETVAATLLASGVNFMRTTAKEKEKRTGYCQMGICFDCLMEIDGITNQQSCLVKVREGMRVKRQYGIKSITKMESTS